MQVLNLSKREEIQALHRPVGTPQCRNHYSFSHLCKLPVSLLCRDTLLLWEREEDEGQCPGCGFGDPPALFSSTRTGDITSVRVGYSNRALCQDQIGTQPGV